MELCVLQGYSPQGSLLHLCQNNNLFLFDNIKSLLFNSFIVFSSSYIYVYKLNSTQDKYYFFFFSFSPQLDNTSSCYLSYIRIDIFILFHFQNFYLI